MSQASQIPGPRNPATNSHAIPQQRALDQEGRISRWDLIVICFLVVFFDGFDTTSIGFVAPTLAREWGLPAPAFTPAFVATSMGAVLGYMISGPLARRLGSRRAIFCSVLLFATGSMATALVASLPSLAILRLITGVGLGVTLPAAVALASAYCPARHREVIAITVTAGIGLGSAFGGMLGGHLIAEYGWRSVFCLGGLLPALLLPFIWWRLPAATCSNNLPGQQFDVPPPSSETSIRALFRGSLALPTTLLWSFSFLIFITVYALYFWLPILLLDFHFSPGETPAGIAFLSIGGLLGALLLIPLSARFGAARVLIFSSLLGAAAIAVVAAIDLTQQQALLGIAVIGAGLLAGTIGQSAIAATLYPAAARTTGIGCAAAVGRIGSILGPAAGGLLLALQRPTREIVLSACIPVLIAAVAIAAFHACQRKPS